MTEFITPNLVGFIALALFMWKITRDISGVEKRLTEKIDGVTNRLSALGERVALTIKSPASCRASKGVCPIRLTRQKES